MNVQKTKKCPFCAEDVNIEAIKCKHCGSMLNNPQSKQNEGKKRIIKTLTFEVTTNGQREMAKKISIMKKDGWKETNRVTETGKYKGGKGCCLFFIFAPLAFLAGHNKDKVIVTFEKYVSEEEMLKEKKILKEKQKNIFKIFYWVLIILFTFWIWYLTIPSIAIWYVWKKTNLEKNKKWIATGLILFIMLCLGIFSAYSSKDTTPTTNNLQNINQNNKETRNEETILETRQEYNIIIDNWKSTEWESRYNPNTDKIESHFWTKIDLTITNNNPDHSLDWLTVKVNIKHPRDEKGNDTSWGRLAVDVKNIKPGDTKKMTVYYPGDLSQVTTMENVYIEIEKNISKDYYKFFKELKNI